MSKSNGATFPQAGNDFYKANGSDTVVFNREPSLTRQEFAEECDINSIMKRYEAHNTGINGLPRQTEAQPFYADFSEMPNNLLEYLTMVKEAEHAFMTLPASIRKEFDNDAVAFVDYASDPNNLDQMRAWGLAPPAKAPAEPMEVRIVPPVAPGPQAGENPPGGAEGAGTHAST